MEKKNKNASRRGGYKRKKNADVKIVVTSVYVGEKPMKDVIGDAIADSFERMEESMEISA